MNSKIKLLCGVGLVLVATWFAFILLNSRKAISCAMEITVVQLGLSGEEKWETSAKSKYTQDFLIDNLIGNGTKVTQIWRTNFDVIVKGTKVTPTWSKKYRAIPGLYETVIGITNDNEIKFDQKQAGCQGNGLTLYRKTLLIKGERRCEYIIQGDTNQYISGKCKRIEVPYLEEQKNQV